MIFPRQMLLQLWGPSPRCAGSGW